MSIQMSFIFLCLVTEMVIISLLVLPLPFKVRKAVVQLSEILIASTHFRVIVGFMAFMMGLLFLDSAKRSTLSYNLGRQQNSGFGAPPPGYLNPFEKATRSYNQRNMYITGLVLYFGLCIPTVVSIIKKILKHKNKYDNAAKHPVSDEAQVAELTKLIEAKDLDIQTLKSQIKNLQTAYNKLSDEVKGSAAQEVSKDK